MNQLIKEIKNLNGKLILIGIDDNNLKQEINNNQNIIKADFLYNLEQKTKSKESIKNKEINIKNFKKHFKKKKTETLIYDFEHIQKYLHIFIKDSIYITKSTIYCVCNYDEELSLIKKRYKRYNVKISNLSEKIIKIDVSNSKNKPIKEKYYYIKDVLFYFIEFASELLLK